METFPIFPILPIMKFSHLARHYFGTEVASTTLGGAIADFQCIAVHPPAMVNFYSAYLTHHTNYPDRPAYSSPSFLTPMGVVRF